MGSFSCTLPVCLLLSIVFFVLFFVIYQILLLGARTGVCLWLMDYAGLVSPIGLKPLEPLWEISRPNL